MVCKRQLFFAAEWLIEFGFVYDWVISFGVKLSSVSVSVFLGFYDVVDGQLIELICFGFYPSYYIAKRFTYIRQQLM